MNPDQHEFEKLRRLLALKRHEQPPPGYFYFFSRQVIARIEAGETCSESTWAEKMAQEFNWVRQLFGAFEQRPLFSSAVGLAFCGLMVAGLWYSDAPAAANITGAPVLFQTADLPSNHHFLSAQPASLPTFSSTNGLLPHQLKQNSIFEPQVFPVKFAE